MFEVIQCLNIEIDVDSFLFTLPSDLSRHGLGQTLKFGTWSDVQNDLNLYSHSVMILKC